MLTSETKRRLQSCRDLLVGKLPQPAQQVELITLALIYKFMDDLDEESVSLGGKRSFFTGPLAPYRWRALLPQTVSADERVALFSGGLEAISNSTTGAHLPALFRDIFRNAFLKFRDGRILTLFLNEINGFAYTHSEELGNAFEFLLQSMGAEGMKGGFVTPAHLIDFTVACLDPRPTDKILDPVCNTGGFLVSSYKHIIAKHTSPGSTVPGDRLGRDQLNRLYNNLSGYDITDLMVQLSKVNLFLHGFPNPAIHIYDTLSNEERWHEKADLIFCAIPAFRPPKGGVTPHSRFRIPAKKAEVLFTDYIAEHLTPDGRAGVIVPNGIVATTQNAYVRLRRFLVEDSLVAVVSLPSGVFKPYSGVKTSILFLDKKLARQTSEILFLKISADGFDLGDQRRPIAANDLPTAEEAVRSWMKNGGATRLAENTITNVTVKKADLLADASVSLSSERYFGETEVGTTEHPLVPLESVLHFMRNGSDVEQRDEQGKFRVSRIQSIADGTFNPEKTKWTDDEVAADRFLQRGDILLSHINSVPHLAKTALFRGCSEPVIHGINLLCLRPNQAVVIPEFLSAWLKTRAFIDKAVTYAKKAVNQASITTSDLKGIEIPLPPLEEQRRIVTELKGYQQVIDSARQILAAYRPSIEIKSEWPILELGEICRLGRGFAFKSEDYKSHGVLNFRVTNIGKDRMPDLSNAVFLPESFLTEYAEYELNEGDFVIVMVGATTGKIGYIPASILPALLNQNMWRFFPDESQLNKRYLYYVIDQLPLLRQGGAQDYLRQSDFSKNPIPLPPLAEQTRIVAELDEEAARMEAVRGLIPAFEAKIARTLARVWGTPAT